MTGPDTPTAQRSTPLARRTGVMRSSKLRELIAATTAGPVLSLGGGLPPPEAFPGEALAAAADRVLTTGAARALQYSPTEGDPDLLGLIAAGLRERLGLPDPTGRLLVTTGSQQALDLLAKVLVDPGDAVVVESPAYVGALRAMAAYEPRLIEVPADDDGLDTRALELALRHGLRPKLCYLVATFSNPSGATLSACRRAHLADLAAHYGFLVIEDDPYWQLRFTGDHLPPVASRGEHVAYLGSFSKVIAPGLRVGYLVVPTGLIRAVVVAKQATDLNSSALTQRLVADLIGDEAWFAGHVARLRRLYAERAEALVTAVQTLPDRPLWVRRPAGGMFAWAGLSSTVDGRITAMAVASAAMRRGVAVVPGDEFSVGGSFPRELRLSFSMLGPADLREAVARLGAAVTEL